MPEKLRLINCDSPRPYGGLFRSLSDVFVRAGYCVIWEGKYHISRSQWDKTCSIELNRLALIYWPENKVEIVEDL